MKIYSKTDIGMHRSMNQDSLFVSEANSNGLKLCILADGMGGYKGGEIASKVAITAVSKYILDQFESRPKDKDSLLGLVEEAIEFANSAIYEESEQDEELQDMGTTIEVVMIYKSKLYIGHIGDSRVYRIRKNGIKKITTDSQTKIDISDDGSLSIMAYSHDEGRPSLYPLACHSRFVRKYFVVTTSSWWGFVVVEMGRRQKKKVYETSSAS